jgi:hypothetical protein
MVCVQLSSRRLSVDLPPVPREKIRARSAPEAIIEAAVESTVQLLRADGWYARRATRNRDGYVPGEIAARVNTGADGGKGLTPHDRFRPKHEPASRDWCGG